MKAKKLSKINLVLKTAIVFDGIINLENKLGILLPEDQLIKQIRDDAKRYNEKIKVEEIKEILHTMLLAGIIFYPRKNFIERITAYKEFMKSKKKNL